MEITINIPTEHTQRVLDAYLEVYTYEDSAKEGETEGQFAKRMLIENIKSFVIRYEQRKAIEQAKQGATTAIEIN